MPRISNKRLAALRSRGRRGARKFYRKHGGAMGGLKFVGGAVKGGVALSLVRQLTPNFAGKYQGALDKVATGALLKFGKFGGPGSAFITVGLAEGVSNLVDDFVLPNVTGLLGGIGSPMKSNGGFVNAKATSR